VFEEEVSPDASSAKRSQTTGHLLLTLPKAKPILQATPSTQQPTPSTKQPNKIPPGSRDKAAVVSRESLPERKGGQHENTRCEQKVNSSCTISKQLKEHLPFEEDPSVPPLI